MASSRSVLEIQPSSLRLKKKIGSGGSAGVFESDYTVTSSAVTITTTVAVKVFDLEAEDSFQNELQVLSQVQGLPHIIGLVGYGRSERVEYMGCIHLHQRQPYLVLEFLPGGSLNDLLKNPTYHVSWGDVLNISYNVADAIDHLHNAHVIHRDIKAGNILFSESGELKLADFGVANTEGQTGTLEWMAPEVFEKDCVAKPELDIFAFGVFLLEFARNIYEKDYFKFIYDFQFMYVTLTGNPGLLSETISDAEFKFKDCPEGELKKFKSLLFSCVAKEAKERPTTKAIMTSLKSMQETAVKAADVKKSDSGAPTSFVVTLFGNGKAGADNKKNGCDDIATCVVDQAKAAAGR